MRKSNKETAVESTETKNQVRLSGRLLSLALRVGLIIVVLVVVFGVVFGLKRMPTALMQPAMQEGDLLLYYRLDRNFQLGDVVIAKHDGKERVLRIVALAGQTVDITEEGQLLIDGYPEATETYYQTAKLDDVEYPYRVQEDEVFLVGDYREAVDDSRKFGAVSKTELKGKVIGRFQVRNL